MTFREDTLYVGDLNHELLVFRLGKNGVPCRVGGGIGYKGLNRIVSCNKNEITIEYYHKGLIGKETLKTRTLTLDSIIEATGLSGYHLNKLKQEFIPKMSRVEMVEDVTSIASWTQNLVKKM